MRAQQSTNERRRSMKTALRSTLFIMVGDSSCALRTKRTGTRPQSRDHNRNRELNWYRVDDDHGEHPGSGITRETRD